MDFGDVEMIDSKYGSIESSDHPRVRTKSLPVPAGITAKGIWAGTVFWRTT